MKMYYIYDFTGKLTGVEYGLAVTVPAYYGKKGFYISKLLRTEDALKFINGYRDPLPLFPAEIADLFWTPELTPEVKAEYLKKCRSALPQKTAIEMFESTMILMNLKEIDDTVLFFRAVQKIHSKEGVNVICHLW